ncbi:LOW QUALITY PROTEIN: hypothetical protein HID58_067032 [Brassica napus]|uniref:AT-hook motif nuclear-localized protein n=1 Tax=Brassica napus TaxID=3708 RepID=A0ABQ7ZHR4_BRANA|nr:LOW QUALITY PROTEIN: hypothetical protein HID58_067032 [Brassica napus]
MGAGIRSSSPGKPTRVTAELAGEHNHATVQLAGKLTGVMVELAGELTRVTVQLSGEWPLCGIRSFVHFRSFFHRTFLAGSLPRMRSGRVLDRRSGRLSVYGPEGRISQLYGRYGSRIRQAGIKSSSPGEPPRVTAELAGEHNHATCNHTAVQLAGELTGVMVELAGELTRVTVQLSGEWPLCGIRSFVHFRSFFQ